MNEYLIRILFISSMLILTTSCGGSDSNNPSAEPELTVLEWGNGNWDQKNWE